MQKQKLWVRFLLPWTIAFSAMAIAVILLARAGPAVAATGTNQQLNYQARLLDSTGGVVADGSYNIEFKIYQDGDGVLGGGDETLMWTETREGANTVTVKNGYFSVYLGSVTAFADNIDWNQDTLWLSVNIGGTGAPSYDGEMSPYTRLSSTPYAINSSQLGGLTSNEFVQLAQGAQIDSSTTDASIFINKTGATADILNLQRGGSDILVIANSGAAVFSNATDSTAALDVQNSSFASLFTVSTDTSVAAATITSTTSSTQVGLVVNNSSSTGNIVDFQDNGTSVLTVQDGAAVVISGSFTTSGGTANINATGTANTSIGNATGTLTINSSALSVTSAGAVSGVTTINASGNITTSGNISTSGSGTISAAAGLTAVSGGVTVTAGDLALTAGALTTNSVSRLTNAGALQNITGLTIISGGASITGGIDNNSDGITETGSLAGVTTISATGNITTSGNFNVTGSGVYQTDGNSGIDLDCGSDQFIDEAIISGGIITFSAGCANDTGLSDERLKTNVSLLEGSFLEKINDIELVNFEFDCSQAYFVDSDTRCDIGELQTGVIAQQLAQVFPELAYIAEDGYYRVRYDALNIYTLKAVSELSDMLKTFNNKVAIETAETNGFAVLGVNSQELLSVDADGNLTLSGSLSASSIDGLHNMINASIQSVLDAGINVSGISNFSGDTAFSGLVSFAESVVFDKDVLINGRVVFNKDSGGFATVLPGQTGVEINFETPFEAPPVVHVSNSDGQFVSFTYTDLTEEGFKIQLQLPATTDVNFSWTATAVKDAQTQVSILEAQ